MDNAKMCALLDELHQTQIEKLNKKLAVFDATLEDMDSMIVAFKALRNDDLCALMIGIKETTEEYYSKIINEIDALQHGGGADANDGAGNSEGHQYKYRHTVQMH